MAAARIRLRGVEEGFAELVAPDTAGEVALTLPARSGTLATNEYLQDLAESLADGTGDGPAPFLLTAQTVVVSVVVPSQRNAISAGPIELAPGVEVTLSEGSSWTVV
jgi:hypothetical protein